MYSSLECQRCQAELTASTVRCPACGAATGLTANQVAAPIPSQVPTAVVTSPARRLVDNPYAVLAAVFLAMAVLGIPLIWMCRAWSPPVKVLLTVLTLAYTALIFWMFWLVMVWVYGQLHDSGLVLLETHARFVFA